MTTRPRGIEHIGFTVPDHDEAVAFFERAFGATVLFSLVKKSDEPMGADELNSKNGLARGTAIVAVSMLRLGNGPNLEIFEIDRPKSDKPLGISDMGMHHFSINVDDIDAVTASFKAAGGKLLDGPYELSGQEEGDGNFGQFGLTPWGMLVEFEQFKSDIELDDGASETRWYPATN
ncbi:MAG: glyoxalase [Ponticaulis sp.]|nr:glyoxalase [Ponticaulis sp.]